MLLRLLLVAVTAYGAAIPQNPSCIEKCLTAGGVVGAAADLNFFKSVAVDVTNFCNVYDNLLKCASACSSEDSQLIANHTIHAAWVCKNKMEEFKTVHDCLEADTADPLAECAKECATTESVPLRLDSSPSAPVNPAVATDNLAPICTKQMCVLKCAVGKLNKQCAGSGNLFKDAARHQVEVGWERLQKQSENANETDAQLVALSYLANIPEKCVFLTNTEVFDREINAEGKKEMMPNTPLTDFSNDTAVETTGAAAGAGVIGGAAAAAAAAAAMPTDSEMEDTTVVSAPSEEESAAAADIHPQPTPAVAAGAEGSGSSTMATDTDEAAATTMVTAAATEEGMGSQAGGDKEAEIPAGATATDAAETETAEESEQQSEESKEETQIGDKLPGEKAAEEGSDEGASLAGETPEKETAAEGAGESNDETVEGGEKMSSETTTPAEPVIVVDDNKQQVDENSVTPVTEKMKVNASSSFSLLLPSVLFLLFAFLLQA